MYELYHTSFEELLELPEPADQETQQLFTSRLKELVAAHQEVIPKLAKGAVFRFDWEIRATQGIVNIPTHHRLQRMRKIHVKRSWYRIPKRDDQRPYRYSR